MVLRRPAQISNLAKAFHDAGRSTGEAEAAFNLARGRFEQAWTHENDENPINGTPSGVQGLRPRQMLAGSEAPSMCKYSREPFSIARTRLGLNSKS